jgi:hypothetical protein
MDDLARAPMLQVPVQTNQYVPYTIQVVLNKIASDAGTTAIQLYDQDGTPVTIGLETYSRLLFGLQDNKSVAISAFQQLCQTDYSYLFPRGDRVLGSKMTWQSRIDRSSGNWTVGHLGSIIPVLNGSMKELSASRSVQSILNQINVQCHPCTVDAVGAEQILYSADYTSTGREIVLSPGLNDAITMAFTDPFGKSRTTDMIFGSQTALGWPVANTDYRVSSVSGNGGNDLNASIDWTHTIITWGSNSVSIAFYLSGSTPAYINIFHIRGRGIYDYQPQSAPAVDAASKLAYGVFPLDYDQPYNDIYSQALTMASTLLANHKNPVTQVPSASFDAHSREFPQFATYATWLDIGRCIMAYETVTGVANCYYVQSIVWECGSNQSIKVTVGNLELASAYLPFLIASADPETSPSWDGLSLIDDDAESHAATYRTLFY